MKRISMHEVYANFASIVSKRSTCLRLKTGAVIVSKDLLRIYSIGYNGTPHNMKHDCSSIEGQCGCLHAEINALLKKNTPEQSIIFCTHSPCITCAKYILQSNICQVYYISEYRDTQPLDLLSNQGIAVFKFEQYES